MFSRPGKPSRPSIFFMKRTLLHVLCFVVLFAFSLYGEDRSTEIDSVLSSAESLFKTMKEKNYQKIWTFLSVKTRNTIVDDVYKAVSKKSTDYTKEIISKDFISGGSLSGSYWNSYLENFNPDLVLEESTWQIGEIERNKAEIIIRHKKSEGPAIVKMFKEGGKWMVGLEETFRSSRQ